MTTAARASGGDNHALAIKTRQTGDMIHTEDNLAPAPKSLEVPWRLAGRFRNVALP
jgi:hypothetical protein